MIFDKNNQVTGMYVLYVASIIMNLVPIFSIASLGAILFLVTFVANYILKFTSNKQSADFTHYHFMTQTIWIFSFLVLIGLGLSYFWGDHSIIANIMQAAQSGVIYTKEQLMDLSASYIQANIFLFGGYFIPVSLYLTYRMGKGFYKSYKKQAIINFRSWL